MSVFRNVMVYLGLGPDEEYDDAYFLDDDHDVEPDLTRRPLQTGYEPDSTGAVGAVRPLRPVRGAASADTYGVTVNREPLPEERNVRVHRPEHPIDLRERGHDDGGGGFVDADGNPSAIGRVTAIAGGHDVVGPAVKVAPMRKSKPVTVTPDSFADARLIADEFMDSVPVIMNLQGLDRDLARRLIDFASGVCYSLNGSMEKIASQVFLLTPRSVEISADDRRRIDERGFARR